MDRRSRAFGNDSVETDSLLGECEHGRPWESCTVPECQEIRRLYQDAVEEERKEENAWIHAQKARKRRGKKKSEYEIGLEQPRILNTDAYEAQIRERENQQKNESKSNLNRFSTVFPETIDLRAAVQFGALTPRQRKIISAYLASDHGMAPTKNWAAIGRQIGCSGKTVEREFQKLVERFFVEKPNRISDRGENDIEVVRIRGERQPRYYRWHRVQFGKWQHQWKELITDPKIVHKLRRELAGNATSTKVPIPSSPVNLLFGDLIRYFASDLPKPERFPFEDINPSDWEYNLRRAQRLLERKHAAPWTALEIYRTLGRGAHLCGACRTFLIRGFRINGRKITRAREYCDDACKMRAERRKRNRAGIPNASSISAVS